MRDYNKIYNSFEKNDKFWDESIFYTIYKDNEEKRLLVRGYTFRYDAGRMFEEWGYFKVDNSYRYKVDIKLSDLLEWNDIDYGMSKYKKEHNYPEDLINYIVDNLLEDDDVNACYSNPEDAFICANDLVKGDDNKGSKLLHFREIQLDTPCGNYFGIGII